MEYEITIGAETRTMTTPAQLRVLRKQELIAFCDAVLPIPLDNVGNKEVLITRIWGWLVSNGQPNPIVPPPIIPPTPSFASPIEPEGRRSIPLAMIPTDSLKMAGLLTELAEAIVGKVIGLSKGLH